MMKKLLAIMLALLAAPAFAVELNPDTGFDNTAAWMLDPVSPNLWTVSGSKANGNGAKVMQMLMGMNPAIKAGHTYRWQLTVAGRTQGQLMVGIGPTMTGSVAGSWVGLRGTIADNFTTASGLTTGSGGGITGGPDGAFRIFCTVSQVANTDPVVYPGLKGRSHTHTSWGNTLSLDVRGSYSFWRANGMTTCGNRNSPTTPINRSAYWMPSMLDGVGHVVKPKFINQYYKGDSPTSTACTTPSDPNYAPGAGGACVTVPTGIEMIGGYNFTTGLGGPADNGYMFWNCHGAGTFTSGGFQRTQHLRDFFHGGCALKGQGGNAPGVGGIISIAFTMPGCWDGLHADSPNHRDHVSYPTRTTSTLIQGCPNSHPYAFPAPNPLVYWNIDQNFYDGKWHLSSDEMVAGIVSTDPGATMHMDFTNAWSPPAIDAWFNNCITPPRSCGGGALGDGTAIKDGSTLTSTNGGAPVEPSHSGDPQTFYYSRTKIGLSNPITSNGTFSGQITADADGRFSLIAIEDFSGNGFNGTVDSFSIVEVASGNHGPVTVTR